MINTSLEITESEYLIKFNRNKFDLSFIRNLLHIVEISNTNVDYNFDDQNNFEHDDLHHQDYYSRIDDK